MCTRAGTTARASSVCKLPMISPWFQYEHAQLVNVVCMATVYYFTVYYLVRKTVLRESSSYQLVTQRLLIGRLYSLHRSPFNNGHTFMEEYTAGLPACAASSIHIRPSIGGIYVRAGDTTASARTGGDPAVDGPSRTHRCL